MDNDKMTERPEGYPEESWDRLPETNRRWIAENWGWYGASLRAGNPHPIVGESPSQDGAFEIVGDPVSVSSLDRPAPSERALVDWAAASEPDLPTLVMQAPAFVEDEPTLRASAAPEPLDAFPPLGAAPAPAAAAPVAQPWRLDGEFWSRQGEDGHTLATVSHNFDGRYTWATRPAPHRPHFGSGGTAGIAKAEVDAELLTRGYLLLGEEEEDVFAAVEGGMVPAAAEVEPPRQEQVASPRRLGARLELRGNDGRRFAVAGEDVAGWVETDTGVDVVITGRSAHLFDADGRPVRVTVAHTAEQLIEALP